MLRKRKKILLVAGLISLISTGLVGCGQQPSPSSPPPAAGGNSANNVCAQKTTNNIAISTSCSAQFTITAVNPSDKNSGEQRSVTSGFSTIIDNPQN
ncbi:MAG: hypothetical protein EVJ46_07110 [Candidatus Acididesulfobacter guangdongensis]|uniref:Uncharacterized protein n=1 Tax=Acididesulfobacter guangdongensis TaxID=2597225 RepID=A0A519BFC3_ACIG2|nr:MAG: hypothetical protein EVJ46_07110 [Candidatus Acididesulfobacter guangdongensis]